MHRPVRALRRSVRGRHLGGHVVARGGGWWAHDEPCRLTSVSKAHHGVESGDIYVVISHQIKKTKVSMYPPQFPNGFEPLIQDSKSWVLTPTLQEPVLV